ncbi:MAG: tyrosine-type recombinase/integrase [Magnetococcales bacterium]|nr:tyrosine-type recombinase/integrase [Magnetococcales bacterium]
MTTFTDRFIKSLTPQERRYEKQGGQGLRIRVHPNGNKSWVLVYQINNKRRRMGLGSYPEISVKDAHKERDIIRELLSKGIDPITHREELTRQAEAQALKDQQEITVQTLVDLYIEGWAKPRKKSWKRDQAMLYKDIVPAWGHRKTKDITRRDVRDLITTISKRGPVMARNTLMVIRKMYNWGITEELIENNPAIGIPSPSQPKPRHRVLTESEIKILWEKLETASMLPSTRTALKLIMMTAQRPGEVIEMEWVDIDDGVWEITSEKSKNGRPNRIPLSIQATELLNTLPKTSKWVFPSPTRFKKGKGHIHETSLPHAVDDNREHFDIPHFTPHDLRRTGSSHIAAMGVARFVNDRILNHADNSVTGRHYDKYEYVKEKKTALDAWGRKLEQIIKGETDSNILNFIEAKAGH